MSSRWPILCGLWRTNLNWMISGLRRRSAWHAGCWSAHHTALSWGMVHDSLLPVMASVLTVSSQHHVQRYVDPCSTGWHIKTRSAYFHQGTCYQCRDMDLDLYSDPWSGLLSNLTICLLAHCQPSLKISCISVGNFLCKVANRQTDRQWWKHIVGRGNQTVSLKCSRYVTK